MQQTESNCRALQLSFGPPPHMDNPPRTRDPPPPPPQEDSLVSLELVLGTTQPSGMPWRPPQPLLSVGTGTSTAGP